MATQTPLHVVVIGREDSPIWNSKDVKALIKKGDDVRRIDIEADAVIGEFAYRTFPKTVKFTVAVIEGLRKAKAKKVGVKDASGENSPPPKKRASKKGTKKTDKAVPEGGSGSAAKQPAEEKKA